MPRIYDLHIRTVTRQDGPVWLSRAVEMADVGLGDTMEAAVQDIIRRIRDTLQKAKAGDKIIAENADVLEAFWKGDGKCATLSIKASFDDVPGQEVKCSYGVVS